MTIPVRLIGPEGIPSACAILNDIIRADNPSGPGYYTTMGFEDHQVARAMPLQDGTPVDRISKRYQL